MKQRVLKRIYALIYLYVILHWNRSPFRSYYKMVYGPLLKNRTLHFKTHRFTSQIKHRVLRRCVGNHMTNILTIYTHTNPSIIEKVNAGVWSSSYVSLPICIKTWTKKNNYASIIRHNNLITNRKPSIWLLHRILIENSWIGRRSRR